MYRTKKNDIYFLCAQADSSKSRQILQNMEHGNEFHLAQRPHFKDRCTESLRMLSNRINNNDQQLLQHRRRRRPPIRLQDIEFNIHLKLYSSSSKSHDALSVRNNNRFSQEVNGSIESMPCRIAPNELIHQSILVYAYTYRNSFHPIANRWMLA